MPLPTPTKKFGELVINDVSLHTPAWAIRDVVHFWYDSDYRSSYADVPGMDGLDPTAPYANDALVSQEFRMVGDVDHEGEAYEADDDYEAWAIGFASNMNYLRTHVLTGRELTGVRTRPAELFVPGEDEPRTADVHCWLSKGAINNKNIWVATLTVKIAQGMFLPPVEEP
jgi:hypothetical protein